MDCPEDYRRELALLEKKHQRETHLEDERGNLQKKMIN
jgi:hypothetical protein